MNTWKNVYLGLFTLLTLVLIGSYLSAIGRTYSTVSVLRTQAVNANLAKLPPVEAFLGQPIWQATDQTRQGSVTGLMAKIHLLGESIPRVILLLTLLMILTIISAFILRQKLIAARERRRNFESLMAMVFAFAAFVLGYVFSWGDYTALMAEVNSRGGITAYSPSAGLALGEQALNTISTGLVISGIGVLLAGFAMFRCIQAYRRWASPRPFAIYQIPAPFARHL